MGIWAENLNLTPPVYAGENQHTIAMKFRKVILKTLVLLFVFCLGYVLCAIEVMFHTNRLDGIHFYLYDMDYKIENFKGGKEKAPSILEKGTNLRPLVEVGPLFVFLLDDGERSWFSVHERSSHTTLVFLENRQQSKLLSFISSVEKNREVPRFMFNLCYSEDGIYERGIIAVYEEDGDSRKLVRAYADTGGIGVFDIMIVYENDITNTYRLNGLVWEKVGDENLEQKWNKRLRRGCNDGRHLRD